MTNIFGGIAMFCPGCGLQISDDLKFCRQCGANLRGVTAEEKRLKAEEKRFNEIKGGVITSLVGVGVMIFLYFLYHELPIDNFSDDDETLRNMWMAGIIPFLVGVGLIINGLFISRRLVKLKEQQAQPSLPASLASIALPAKTTDQLVADVTLSSGASVTEDPTAHLAEPAPAPLRREAD
jgi:hypothetical protein